MRKSNQDQSNKSNTNKIPNSGSNYTIISKQNTYQSKNYQPKTNQSNKQTTVYISGKTIQPSDVSNKVMNSSGYSNQQGNQRFTTQTTNIRIEQKIEKRTYTNQVIGNNDNMRLKQGGLSSLISSTESNKENLSKKENNKFNRDNKFENRENIRGLNKEQTTKNHNNRPRSYLTERRDANNLSLPKNKDKKTYTASSAEIKRKTIIRGGNYNNIQVTHIYVTKKPNINTYNFHIIENLSRSELDKKPLDLNKIRSKIKRNDKAKSTYKSSCDGRKIVPVSKDKIQKITVYQHARGMGMTNLEPNKITSNLYTSGIKKIPKLVKQKGKPIVQIIEVFRSQQNNINLRRNNNNSINNKNNINTFNKSYTNLSNTNTINLKSKNTYTSNINKNKNTNKKYSNNTRTNNIITINTRDSNNNSMNSSYNMNNTSQNNYNKNSRPNERRNVSPNVNSSYNNMTAQKNNNVNDRYKYNQTDPKKDNRNKNKEEIKPNNIFNGSENNSNNNSNQKKTNVTQNRAYNRNQEIEVNLYPNAISKDGITKNIHYSTDQNQNRKIEVSIHYKTEQNSPRRNSEKEKKDNINQNVVEETNNKSSKPNNDINKSQYTTQTSTSNNRNTKYDTNNSQKMSQIPNTNEKVNLYLDNGCYDNYASGS